MHPITAKCMYVNLLWVNRSYIQVRLVCTVCIRAILNMVKHAYDVYQLNIKCFMFLVSSVPRSLGKDLKTTHAYDKALSGFGSVLLCVNIGTIN